MKQEDQIKELRLKGLKDDEIARALGINITDIKTEETNVKTNSVELYTALQRDLTRLILKEGAKPDSDGNVILNAIKLQAELQEKKLSINKSIDSTKISKTYIYNRDKEIYEATQKDTIENVAEKFNISILSVKQAIDRIELNLPEELKQVNPSFISETIGLDRNTRIKIIIQAINESLTRKDVREIVNRIKNEQR